MFTQAEENYLKAIYKITQNTADQTVNTKAIADELGTTSASVTDMIKKLTDKSLLSYEKYYGVSLTKEGQKMAIKLLRKHRLWEVFLHDKLGFNWDEVHDVAEQLEHIQSLLLIERLDAFLDYPKFDPHGDPIPNENGNFTYRNQVSLSSIKESGKQLIMLGVKRHHSEFLKYLDSIHLKPGAQLKILSIQEYDQSIKLRVEDRDEILITQQVSQDILVKP
ncbi:MAG: metal-dependent transcriptional regulator [Saprospiraceae bacterium]|nr:metal-dependent transcriptional regulator [Saprospiraceae bacterium]MBK7737950.1 metal-dependent transcriptional regulator [Saprospiraceae bacterium]MBK7913471.1 metal-dependent transcriptional regulator [Saprospiraceae bacterium]